MRKIIYVCALIASFGFFTSCNDDDEKDSTWKGIPQTEITVGSDAVLNINGTESTTGTVQMTVANESTAVLVLKNAFPGYTEVSVNVGLEKQADDSFSFSGETSLSTPTAMLTRATEILPAILNVAVRGSITLDGKASVSATSELTENAQGGLVGTWALSHDFFAVDADGFPLEEPNGQMPDNAPVVISWTANNKQQLNGEEMAYQLSFLGSHLLAEVLQNVTFNGDGSLSAKYYPDVILKNYFGEYIDAGSFMEWVMNKTAEFEIRPYEREWLTAPSNLVQWYTKDGYFYLVPNIAKILKEASGDNSGLDAETILNILQNIGTMDDATLRTTLNALGTIVGVDLSSLDASLVREVLGWLVTGVPLKYEVTNGAVSFYVDKDMVAPFMSVLVSFLPILQTEFDKLAAEDETGMMNGIWYMLGIEKFADIETIWKNNTQDFNIKICFKQ